MFALSFAPLGEHLLHFMEKFMFELKNNTIKISVRHLVEFLFRSGDIRSGQGAVQSEKGMEAGSRIHRKIQKSMPVSYQSEVALKTKIHRKDYDILIEGRADGIDKRPDCLLIDEIKGTYRNLDNLKEPDFLHKAQAMCYGYMYLQDMTLSLKDGQMELIKEQKAFLLTRLREHTGIWII